MSEEQNELELSGVVKEISIQLTKIENARDQINEIINDAHAELGIEKKLIRKVSRFYHKKNISSYQTEALELQALYSQVTAPI